MKLLLILTIIFFSNSYASYKGLLFNGNCVTCHKTDDLNKSAPSIQEIQSNYKNAFPNKKDFINYMSEWVVNPNEETSLMNLDIKKYGLMPELGYDKVTIKEIAEYIYDTEF